MTEDIFDPQNDFFFVFFKALKSISVIYLPKNIISRYQIEVFFLYIFKLDPQKRVNENLFTDPLDDIGSCMVYISVCKLYLFLINLFFMDQVYRETKFIADYPILNDIFLDHGIISFIMCDSIDTFIVYFYSSRYQVKGRKRKKNKIE